MARVYELPTGTAIDLDQLFAVGPVGGHSYWDVSFTLTFLAWIGPVRNPQDYVVCMSDHLAYRDRTDWYIPEEEQAAAAARKLLVVQEYAERVRSELIAAWKTESAGS